MKCSPSRHIHLVSLGCARNLVDSEVMLGRLEQAGWLVTDDPARAEAIVVNTCSFIEKAVDESLDVILSLSDFKQKGRCRRLIVAGCLPERFREEIAERLPEVDVFLGTGAFGEILQAVEGGLSPSACLLPDPDSISWGKDDGGRIRTTLHMAYVKIAEGCSRHCTYCIIPRLRGRHKSRPPAAILDEARMFLSAGVKELVLVAQDTTAYGCDFQPAFGLDRLLEALAGLGEKPSDGFGGFWVRFLYGHPKSLEPSVLRTVAAHALLCPYFDIPVQHAADPVLKRMGRGYGREDLVAMFAAIRSQVPDAVLRTTVIVGFPGETKEDFQDLLDFVEAVRFDHLGVFIYSDSQDLPSHRLSGHIPKRTAKSRYDRIMKRQAEISLDHNQRRVGKTFPVLVEEAAEKGLYIGRCMFQAPEVDGITYIHGHGLKAGAFCRVKVIQALEYDLIGEAQ